VVNSAPIETELQTVAYDETVINLSGDGPLRLNSTAIERLEAGYESPYGVVVLTLYNDDPINDIPNGNSYGYRVTLDMLNQVHPGDRISATVNSDRDVAAIEQILSVDRAEEAEETALRRISVAKTKFD